MSSSERNCYCKEGQEYCGKCYKCGEKGHIRHHPFGPVTTGFCDKHYQEECDLMDQSLMDENTSISSHDENTSTSSKCVLL